MARPARRRTSAPNARRVAILHHRDTSPCARTPYSVRGDFLPGSLPHNVADKYQARGRDDGQAAGRAAGLCLGLQLDRRGLGPHRGVTLEPALCRRRHRRRDPVCRRRPHRPRPTRAARRNAPRDDRRFLQRRGVSDSVRLCAAQRRNQPRHHHHLFDADLDDHVEHRHPRGKAFPHPRCGILFVRGGIGDPARGRCSPMGFRPSSSIRSAAR